jgi:signal transduction histidine kinase
MSQFHQSAPHPQPGPEPIRLLLIDDDAVDRESYRRHLSTDRFKRYVIDEAESAYEGARMLAASTYDCVVLDYRLPGADGLTLLQTLRDSDGGLPAAPVIMMTGQGSESVAVAAMKLGIADYLRKDSLTTEAFLRAINNSVTRWRLHAVVGEKSRRLEQANAELERKAEEMQRLYHVVSHELKTPLTAVREFIALVLDGVAGPQHGGSQKEFLELALDGCDQIARHVNDLSDSSRLESEKLRLNVTPVRTERTISFALASIRAIAAAKHLTLTTDIAPNLPQVLADEVRFTQILGNLLGNAAKFTPPRMGRSPCGPRPWRAPPIRSKSASGTPVAASPRNTSIRSSTGSTRCRMPATSSWAADSAWACPSPGSWCICMAAG